MLEQKSSNKVTKDLDFEKTKWNYEVRLGENFRRVENSVNNCEAGNCELIRINRMSLRRHMSDINTWRNEVGGATCLAHG